ncbi:MAG TPA: ankyrin repeat domain-containing protein [Gemmatimonadales bacterium]
MNQAEEFLEAVRRGDGREVSALLDVSPELVRLAGEHGKTGLHWAAEADGIDVARTLVDAGADIEARTSWGASPLDWAATMGSTRVAAFLLSRGAGGLTLITAAALGMQPEVEAVVESGRDFSPHRRRDAPRTPNDHWPTDSAHLLGDILSDALYAAARNGHTPVVEYLLSRGASIDAKGVFGATGLHWAAMNGHAGTVELLISRGANLELKDARFGATALGWAEEGGHTHIADLLRRSGRTAR